MNSVNSVDNFREFVWCQHVRALGRVVNNSLPGILQVDTPGVHLVTEEGKIKVLCAPCLLKALQMPFH